MHSGGCRKGVVAVGMPVNEVSEREMITPLRLFAWVLSCVLIGFVLYGENPSGLLSWGWLAVVAYLFSAFVVVDYYAERIFPGDTIEASMNQRAVMAIYFVVTMLPIVFWLT